MYEWALFLHLVGATLFFAGLAVAAVGQASARRRSRPSEIALLLGTARWGVVLVCLAVGFALIEFFGWDDVTPGAIAVLLGATGVGNLVSYYISRDLPK